MENVYIPLLVFGLGILACFIISFYGPYLFDLICRNERKKIDEKG